MNVLTYEQLKQRLDAVVAECAVVKSLNSKLCDELRGYETDNEDFGPAPQSLALAYSTETHAADAALAEVEAKAALPANWDDLLFNEMNRRFELKRHDDDYLTNGDTQIGVEFAIEFIKQLREAR